MFRPDDRHREWIEVYLREIGVHTPISFFLEVLEADQDAASHRKRPPQVEEKPQARMDVQAELARLADEAAACRRCRLAETRNKVVFGVGAVDADLVFIGEAPGREEDAQGEPFVGRAGRLLDRMLAAIGLDRGSVYIMNTIKCRPPNNRDPRPDELQACHFWFEKQLNLLRPKVLCLLGRVAAQTLLETDAPLGELRGRWHEYRGIAVRATYHPAYLLRSPERKKESWKDLLAIQEKLEAMRRAASE